MPRHSEDRHIVQILFTKKEYEELSRYASLKDISMSNIVREFTMRGINGELTEKNIDFLTPIIRSQLESIIDYKFERLASLTAKTCIQAGTAAYLSAEALNSFVPPQHQRSFLDAYDAARAKSLQYLKSSGGVTAESKPEN